MAELPAIDATVGIIANHEHALALNRLNAFYLFSAVMPYDNNTPYLGSARPLECNNNLAGLKRWCHTHADNAPQQYHLELLANVPKSRHAFAIMFYFLKKHLIWPHLNTWTGMFRKMIERYVGNEHFLSFGMPGLA